jgi:hypothetical protein
MIRNECQIQGGVIFFFGENRVKNGDLGLHVLGLDVIPA